MRSVIYKVFAISVILFVILAGLFVWLYFIPHPEKGFGHETKYIVIKKGQTLNDLTTILKKEKAISSKANFIFLTRILGKDKKIKTGRYALKRSYSAARILRMVTRGEATPFDVTVPEGYTLTQIAHLLESQIDLDVDAFRKKIADRDLLDSLNIKQDDLEGYLAPSTYKFFYEENPRRIVRKMVSHFFDSLPDSFETKANRLGLTFHEAVTLASMIEEEAMLDLERPIIAAVYLNRLRKRMRMECDPTVIYAMGGLDRPLLRKDLKYPSPYMAPSAGVA